MMRQPLTITFPITTQEIAQLARREKDGGVRQRLTAMKFISQGQTIPQVAKRMKIAERPLRKWLHRLNEQGLKGLGDAPRSGQPPKLEAKHIEAFKQRLRQGATETDPVCSLRGKDLQQILQKEFNASYSLGGT
jgi:transposase